MKIVDDVSKGIRKGVFIVLKIKQSALWTNRGYFSKIG